MTAEEVNTAARAWQEAERKATAAALEAARLHIDYAVKAQIRSRELRALAAKSPHVQRAARERGFIMEEAE